MTDWASRIIWGLGGLIVGFMLAGMITRAQGPTRGFMPLFGAPEVMILVFVTFWIVLIAVAIKWLFNPRGHLAASRLADLPADFDDWHRRAHAQMDREAATRAGGTQP